MQGTQVQPLVREDSTHRGATKLSATPAEPALESPSCALREDPGPQSREQLRIASARGSPQRAAKAQCSRNRWLAAGRVMQRSEGRVLNKPIRREGQTP